MTDLREAAQQALEAMEHDGLLKKKQAITALRAALAQEELIRPTVQEMQNAAANLKLMEEMFGGSTALEQQEQEPVARVLQTVGQYHTGLFVAEVETVRRLRNGESLYTAPPRREWRSLSEEEINALPEVGGKMWNMGVADAVLRAIRAVEQALKEKNHE